jgi:hypothetical protein
VGGEADHAQRIAAVADHRQQVVDPSLDVSLAHPELDPAVEDLHHRHRVELTVVPGLMRTGSHLQARFTGQAEKEFTWFGLGASAPLVSMDAERAARQIVEAVRQRRAEVILTPAGQVVSRVAGERPYCWPGRQKDDRASMHEMVSGYR